MNLLIIYLIVGLCLAYVLNHQRNIVELISSTKDLKTRKKIAEKQKQLNLYIKLCPVWPFLLVKEAYDEIQKRR